MILKEKENVRCTIPLFYIGSRNFHHLRGSLFRHSAAPVLSERPSVWLGSTLHQLCNNTTVLASILLLWPHPAMLSH